MSGGWSWRTFAVSLGVLSTLLGLWGLATPLFGVPDEPAHFLKSAGVVRGQVTGLPGLPTAVSVPPALAATRLQTGCFVFQPAVPADCAPGYDGPDGPDVEARTQAGRDPPAYSALVGLPTLVWTDLASVYAVRGVSAALCAALLAAAVTAAAATGRRLLVLAVGLALTPMALFLGAAVNPSGPEIAAALALWSAGTALALATGPPSRPVLTTAGLAGVVLVLSRPISPLWLAVIGLSVLVIAGRGRVLELARLGSVQAWVAVLVLAAAAQTAWVLLAGSLELFGTPQRLTVRDRLAGSLERTDQRLQQMVGWFGWLDTPAPVWVHLGWAGAVVLLAGLGLRRAALSRAVLLAGLVVLVVAVPTALEVASANVVGFYWQGRYTLPLGVGVVLVAAALGRRAAPVPVGLQVVLLALVGTAHVASFVVALGRHTVGTGNGLGLLDVRWEPPLPAPVLALGSCFAALAWSLWLARLPLAQPAYGSAESSSTDIELPPGSS